MQFDWDKNKAEPNLSKQPVSFEEAKTIFDDSLYVEFYDPNYLEGVDIMLFKGIKKGKIIELLEKVDFPDNEEVLVEIREVNGFWSALPTVKNERKKAVNPRD
jgi:hypothetical protein